MLARLSTGARSPADRAVWLFQAAGSSAMCATTSAARLERGVSQIPAPTTKAITTLAANASQRAALVGRAVLRAPKGRILALIGTLTFSARTS